MERLPAGCGPTSPYSVRISRADSPGDLLGTGTLLIRREDKTAWLLTCAHVFFSEEDEGTQTGAQMVTHAVNIEYAYQAEKYIGGYRRVLDLSKSVVKAGELRRSSRVEEDFVCLELPWEAWMRDIPDTVFASPSEGGDLTGYGFPKRNNKEYEPNDSVMRAIDRIKATVHVPDANGYFVIKYDAFEAEERDDQSMGFSGTGLFNEKQQLTGIISAPNGQGSGVFEMKIFPALRLRNAWDRSPKKIPWERFSLFWCLREPNRLLFRSPLQRVNLFYLLGGICGSAAVLLLNHQGAALEQVLSSLDALLPYREWRRFELNEGRIFNPEELKGGGAVIPVTFRRGDWRKAEDFLDSRWETAGCLLLFCVDISQGSESEFIPGDAERDNLQEAWEKIPSSFREKIYYLLSTTCFVEEASDLDPDSIQFQLSQAEKEKDPCQSLSWYLREHSSAYYDVMKLAARSESEALRTLGCRLAIQYGRLLGKPCLHTFFSAGSVGFLKDILFDTLNEEESASLLGQLALANDNMADAVLRTICEDPLLGTGRADLVRLLQTLAQEGSWTCEFLEPRLDGLTHPALEQILLCLNDLRRTQADYDALLGVLENWTDQSFYWKVRLCSRWGVQQLSDVLSEDGGQIAAMLLDPQPDMVDSTAWDYAAVIREQLFS